MLMTWMKDKSSECSDDWCFGVQQTFSKRINTFSLITRILGSEQIEKPTAAQNKYQIKIQLYLSLLSMCWSFWCSKRTFTEWLLYYYK